PRDPGLRPARISRRTAGERAGLGAREIQDHRAAGRDWVFDPGRSRRQHRPGGHDDRARAAVGVGDRDALHRLGLFSRRSPASDRGMTVKVLYFAWLRERVGKPEEEIDPPPGIATVGELMGWLAGRGEEYAHAFDNPRVIRAAIDRTHVRADAAI